MRTAPGDLANDLPRVWLCGGCQARIVRFRTPEKCPACSGTQLRPQENYSHGKESPQTRRRIASVADNPDAEALDRAIAAMALARPRLRTIVFLHYLQGYSVSLVAEYLGCPWYRARAWIDMAQCWVEGWLSAREVRHRDDPGAQPEQRPRRERDGILP